MYLHNCRMLLSMIVRILAPCISTVNRAGGIISYRGPQASAPWTSRDDSPLNIFILQSILLWSNQTEKNAYSIYKGFPIDIFENLSVNINTMFLVKVMLWITNLAHRSVWVSLPANVSSFPYNFQGVQPLGLSWYTQISHFYSADETNHFLPSSGEQIWK